MSDPSPTPGGETPAHRDLKRLALVWAQSNGYRVAAAEVSLPNLRIRRDVAAYRATWRKGREVVCPVANPAPDRARFIIHSAAP